MLFPILFLLKEGEEEEVEVEHLVKVLHPRRRMGRGCARRPSGLQTALPAGHYLPNFICNDTESDVDYRPIYIALHRCRGFARRNAIRCTANRIFFKVLY